MRARRSADLAKAIAEISYWKEIKFGDELLLRGETSYRPFKSVSKKEKETELSHTCRIIVTKSKRADGQIDVFTKEAYNYKVIITNDFSSTADEVFHFYNQRGATEKQFDILKNDFGWHHLPFSKLEDNNVYLIFTAICKNIYDYIIKSYAKKYKWLKQTYRIKKFIFRFISVPAKWVKHARQDTLILYGPLKLREGG